jgi:protein-S-isoprenylcysteine O-methyltransferase Ste14
MNNKRIFGVLLTLLGLVSLLYTVKVFRYATDSDIKNLIVYGGFGVFFFIIGISLILPAKSES